MFSRILPSFRIVIYTLYNGTILLLFISIFKIDLLVFITEDLNTEEIIKILYNNSCKCYPKLFFFVIQCMWSRFVLFMIWV